MKQLKTSLKPIPPTLRGKKRYLSFQLQAGKSLAEKEVSQALWQNFLQLYGSLGTARQKIWLAYFDAKKNQGVLRCALEHVEEVKAGLLFLEEVSSTKVVPVLGRASGSIKGLKSRK